MYKMETNPEMETIPKKETNSNINSSINIKRETQPQPESKPNSLTQTTSQSARSQPARNENENEDNETPESMDPMLVFMLMLMSVVCCLPLGIAVVIILNKAKPLWEDYESNRNLEIGKKADKMSKMASKLTIVAIIIGCVIVFIALNIGLFFVLYTNGVFG